MGMVTALQMETFQAHQIVHFVKCQSSFREAAPHSPAGGSRAGLTLQGDVLWLWSGCPWGDLGRRARTSHCTCSFIHPRGGAGGVLIPSPTSDTLIQSWNTGQEGVADPWEAPRKQSGSWGKKRVTH